MSAVSSNSAAPRPASPRARPMLLVLAALVFGVWIDDAQRPGLGTWLAAAAGFGAIWLLFWILQRRLAILALAGLLAAVGGLRNHVHLAARSGSDLAAPAAPAPIAIEAVALTGARIIPPPEATPLEFLPPRSRTQLLIEVRSFRDGENWRPARGRARLRVMGKLDQIGAGDRLRIFGEYSAAPQRGNPGEPDWSRQMALDGVDFDLRCEAAEQVTIVERGSALSIARWIGFQRQAWIDKLHRTLGDRRGGLAAAILLGAREQLDRPRLDAYLLVGMSHILVVSGANVAILAGGLLWMQRVFDLPRGLTIFGIAIFVIWFALLADADAPVTRAAAGMLVLLLARLVGRRLDSVQAWSAAGAAVILLNPAYLFSLGAQLSFLSVATLIEAAYSMAPPARVGDPLARLIFQSRPWPARMLIRAGEILWEGLRTSFWVWIVTTPLVWQQFGFLSWGPILLNPLLALPFMVTLYAGMLFLLVDGWIPFAGPVLGEICRASLDGMDWAVGFFQSAHAPMRLAPPPPLGWVVGFYVVALGLVALASRERRTLLETINRAPGRPPTRSGVASAVIAALFAAWLCGGFLLGAWEGEENRAREPRLRMTFLSVGHGTCVLLEMPNDETWVYDAGSQSDGRGAARILWEALLAARKSQIDRIIISHDDVDHYSALPTLLKRVHAGRISWTRDFTPPQSEAGKYLAESIERAGAATEVIERGTSWKIGGADLRVLHPSREESFGSDNSRSVVLEIEYGGRRVLLPGDLETPGLELVLSEPTRPFDLVMAPHHGSERSVPGRFAAWARPKYVIISGDEEDRRDATIGAYASAGAEVFHTAEDGAVIVEILETGEMKVRGLLKAEPQH